MCSRTCCGVPGEMHALEVDVVGRDRVEVALDRHLRVDDDALAAGELHDDVGAQQPAVVVALARLRAEVAVVEHPGELDDALQLHLAPAAADVGRPQRRHEAAGLGAQLLLPGRDLAEALADRGHLAGALVLELLRLRLELGQRLLDRRELRLGELEQRGLALQERVAGRRLEPVLPLALALLDGRQLVRRPPEPLAQPEVDARRLRAPGRAGERRSLPWADGR